MLNSHREALSNSTNGLPQASKQLKLLASIATRTNCASAALSESSSSDSIAKAANLEVRYNNHPHVTPHSLPRSRILSAQERIVMQAREAAVPEFAAETAGVRNGLQSHDGTGAQRRVQVPSVAVHLYLRSLMMRKRRLEEHQRVIDAANQVLDTYARLDKMRGRQDAPVCVLQAFPEWRNDISIVNPGRRGVAIVQDDTSTSSSSSAKLDKERASEKWHKKYNELKNFMREHGHSLVPPKLKGNQSLSRWVQRQRAMKQQSKLSDYQRRLLNEVGFY